MSRSLGRRGRSTKRATDAVNVAYIRRAALRWFDRHQRDLPWRKNRSLYRVWISEIMLQQTQVATVIPYFQRFLEHFPNVAALAAADESEVLRQWEGLGYYRRARQLHRAAQLIQSRHSGRCPDRMHDWLALPGIGRYTAGAILSIAANQRWPILEANTVRLYCRILGLRADPRGAAAQKRLWQFAESLLPKNRCGDFNQALMEIGSLVCTPRQPKCESCPLRTVCAANLHQLTDRIPRAAPKARPTPVRQVALIVRKNGQILLRQCAPGERWAGLWDLPRFETTGQGDLQIARRRLRDQSGLKASFGPKLFTLRHTVTRFQIELDCHEATRISGRLLNGSDSPWQWVKFAEIARFPLNVTARRITARVLA